MDDRSRVIAVDVGGTTIKAALFDRGPTRLAAARAATPVGDADAVVAEIAELVRRLRPSDAQVGAIGLVVPGVVDDRAGVAIWSENLRWRDAPLRALVAERTGLPVVLSHDVRAAGLAEHRLGAGAGARHLAYVSIGTGIAAALIVDGRLLVRGGYAGEIGHVDAGVGDEPCACGGRGCVEAVASARAIAHRYSRAAGRRVAGAEEVVALARAGDPTAAGIWSEAVDALGRALAWLAGVLVPERIVVGGGLSLAGPALMAPLEEAMRARLTFQPVPELRPAVFGDEAGCLGAALLALDLPGPVAS